MTSEDESVWREGIQGCDDVGESPRSPIRNPLAESVLGHCPVRRLHTRSDHVLNVSMVSRIHRPGLEGFMSKLFVGK